MIVYPFQNKNYFLKFIIYANVNVLYALVAMQY